MDLKIPTIRKRDLLNVLSQIQENTHRTENLILEADKIIRGLEIELKDFCAELDDDDTLCAEQIRPRPDSISTDTEIDQGAASQTGDNNFNGLNIGERVVWLVRDDEPELGTVLWIGTMSDGLVAGVEFDDAIGNTDGNLDGQRIFQCKPLHGRFVLVRELILWKDFAG